MLTEGVKKAQAEAVKRAEADGKKGEELRAALEAPTSLTDAQKAALKKARVELAQLVKGAAGRTCPAREPRPECQSVGIPSKRLRYRAALR